MVTRIGPCYGSPVPVVSVGEFSITTKTHDSAVSGDIHISRNIENGWTLKATMQKCQDLRNTDTCDYFRSYYILKDGCSSDSGEEAELYTMIFHYIEPNMDCPIQAGDYYLSQFPVFTEDNYLTVHESKISTSVFGYTYTLEGFDKKNETIFCLEAFLQLLYIRDHNWLAKPKLNNEIKKKTSSEDDNEETS
ncbi:uncharacterized protein LOC114240375 [Bombyx mandarina]|uniref:Uncharacterized protein LOC114240375 n=2 Tax=Bombyx TaxID=7090 RepID=A0A6J2JDV4_BOMMA|nr:uncharacterized protein LOC114240375 [Bombyx mandarina]